MIIHPITFILYLGISIIYNFEAPFLLFKLNFIIRFMATFLDIRNSQLNNSKFKQLYSFPKANRFINQNYISQAPYYDNKITSLGTRATSLGYGNKYTLENKEEIPPPNTYHKEGSF